MWTSLDMGRVNSGSQVGSHEGSSHYEWHVALGDLGVVSTASGELGPCKGVFSDQNCEDRACQGTWFFQPTADTGQHTLPPGIPMCSRRPLSWFSLQPTKLPFQVCF